MEDNIKQLADGVKRKSVLTENNFSGTVVAMEQATVIDLLRKQTNKTSQSEVARAIGVSAQYLNDVLRGARAPSEKILEYLGLKRDIVKIR